MENKEQLINKYRAEFENACDDLYYGYGYKFWRTHNNSIEDDNIAKMVWKAAFNKMSANESKTKNMKKNTVKINEGQLKKIVAESVKKMLKENIVASAPTFKELQIVLNKVTGILSKFSNNIPQEQSDEFMKLAGREWNDLWESLSSLEETVIKINNPRGLSDSDLTFDDLS